MSSSQTAIGTTFLSSITSFDNTSTSPSTSLVGPIPVFTASPSSSTIVSISKGKEVSPASPTKTPLKLLLTGKEIDEEIVLPKIDMDNATIDEMRLLSKRLEMKARQK